VDLNSIQDEVQRKSIEAQINNFGQTPTQLFKFPHPKKRVHRQDPEGQLQETALINLEFAIVDFHFLSKSEGRYWSVFLSSSNGIETMKLDIDLAKNQINLEKLRKVLSFSWSHATSVLREQPTPANIFPTNESELYYANFPWINGILQFKVDSSPTKQFLAGFGQIGRFRINEKERDIFVLSENLVIKSKLNGKNEKELVTYFGHETKVTDFDISTVMNMVVSCSLNGIVLIHELDSGICLHQIRILDQVAAIILGSREDARLQDLHCVANQIVLAKDGSVAISCSIKYQFGETVEWFAYIFILSVNGRVLGRLRVESLPTDMIFSVDGNFLFVTTANKELLTLSKTR
jgi:hypothetical protein